MILNHSNVVPSLPCPQILFELIQKPVSDVSKFNGKYLAVVPLVTHTMHEMHIYIHNETLLAVA